MKKTGANIMNMVNSMNSSSSSNTIPKKKKKMAGPSVNFDDIP